MLFLLNFRLKVLNIEKQELIAENEDLKKNKIAIKCSICCEKVRICNNSHF